MSNRLIHESNPYLLQHAHNLVDWYPWGAEVLARAKREDKPIFLSVGYSTCHWCHVMARESFEDREVAEMLNRYFISIKVDREERPDIDGIYMIASHVMNGSGGWPLNIFLTPDLKPFFAATYIPKKGKDKIPGMLEILPRVEWLWATQRDQVVSAADSIVKSMRGAMDHNSDVVVGVDLAASACDRLTDLFDGKNGGFYGAPKFPMAHNLIFLLNVWRRTGDAWLLEMVDTTLDAMSRGGIFDHLGGGFHRYAVDAKWSHPHFEKMLCDQALMSMAYAEGFAATGNASYWHVADDTVGYVLMDLTSREGAFFSAEDAESDGKEGSYYLWSKKELREILDDEEFRLVSMAYGISSEEGRANVLHMTDSLKNLAVQFGMDVNDYVDVLSKAKQKLSARRRERSRPFRDEKILTDWNGLMIAALARTGRIMDRSVYISAASRAADFVFDKMVDEDGGLFHRRIKGETEIAAFLDDYAFLAWGMLELYEATGEERYLGFAVDLTDRMIQSFWDEEHGGFFATSAEGENILLRRKDASDGNLPSGNSVAINNLVRLAKITGNEEMSGLALRAGNAFAEAIKALPESHTQLLNALVLLEDN